MKKIIVINQKAKDHLKTLLQNGPVNNKYIHPTENDVSGGYFFDEKPGKWVAFCNHSKDCNVEDFDTREKASRYVIG